MKAPVKLPSNGISANPAMAPGGKVTKVKLKHNPAEAKKRGTKNPSATLRNPGMISRRTW